MTKSELIEALAKKQRHLTLKDVNLAADCIIEHMCQTLIGKYLLHTGMDCRYPGYRDVSCESHPWLLGSGIHAGTTKIQAFFVWRWICANQGVFWASFYAVPLSRDQSVGQR